jgi:uncharacterized protein YggT (Ycf19 family)
MGLLEQNFLHIIIYYFFTVLIILMFVRFILSWFRINESNPIMLFLVRSTEPFIAPIRRRIPPLWVVDVSWFFAWTALLIMRVVLIQALPTGW